MKKKLSVTLDENKVELIEHFVNEGSFRNRSHVIEYALERFLEGRE